MREFESNKKRKRPARAKSEPLDTTRRWLVMSKLGNYCLESDSNPEGACRLMGTHESIAHAAARVGW